MFPAFNSQEPNKQGRGSSFPKSGRSFGKATRFLKAGDYVVRTPGGWAVPITKGLISPSHYSTTTGDGIYSVAESNPDYSPSYPNALITIDQNNGGSSVTRPINTQTGAVGTSSAIGSTQGTSLLIPLTNGNFFAHGAHSSQVRFCSRDMSGADVIAETSIASCSNPSTTVSHDPRTGNLVFIYPAVTTNYPTFLIRSESNSAVVAATTLESVAVDGNITPRSLVLENGNVLLMWARSTDAWYFAIYTQAGVQVVAPTSLALTSANHCQAVDLGNGKFAIIISQAKIFILSYSGSIIQSVTLGTQIGFSNGAQPRNFGMGALSYPSLGFGVFLCAMESSTAYANDCQLAKIYSDGSLEFFNPQLLGVTNDNKGDFCIAKSNDGGIILGATRLSGTTFSVTMRKIHVGGISEAYRVTTNTKALDQAPLCKLTAAEVEHLNISLRG